MITKFEENFGDRFRQAVDLFTVNWVKLIIPYLVLSLTNLLIISGLSHIIFFPYLNSMVEDNSELNFQNIQGASEAEIESFATEVFTFFQDNPKLIISFIIGVFVYYLLFLLVVTVVHVIVKYIAKDIIHEKEINLSDVIKKGFTAFQKLIPLYFHLFLYIYGYYFLFLILFVSSLLSNNGIMIGIVLLLGIVPFILMLYRMVISLLTIYNAIDTDNFSVQEAKRHIQSMKPHFWRILGNWLAIVMLFGLVVGTLVEIISSIVVGIPYAGSIIQVILYAFQNAFVILFLYIFYKRLDFETRNPEQEVIESEV